MITELVLATSNPGKVAEYQSMFAEEGIKIIPQSEFGVPDADEPYCTFLENALTKARNASRHTGRPALADDSGICIPALGNIPGVVSARFSELNGGPRTDAANCALLAERMQGLTDRRAVYVTVLALVRSPTDPRPIIAEGTWDGLYMETPDLGSNSGFGYDPHFFCPVNGLRASQMRVEYRAKVNQRYQAMVRMQALISKEYRKTFPVQS